MTCCETNLSVHDWIRVDQNCWKFVVLKLDIWTQNWQYKEIEKTKDTIILWNFSKIVIWCVSMCVNLNIEDKSGIKLDLQNGCTVYHAVK